MNSSHEGHFRFPRPCQHVAMPHYWILYMKPNSKRMVLRPGCLLELQNFWWWAISWVHINSIFPANSWYTRCGSGPQGHDEDLAVTVEFSREMSYWGTCAQTTSRSTGDDFASRQHSPSQTPKAHSSEAGADFSLDTHTYAHVHTRTHRDTYNLFIRFLKTMPFRKWLWMQAQE